MITLENVRLHFPAPCSENPFCGNDIRTVMASSLSFALQILRCVPDGPDQQEALQKLLESVEAAKRALPPLPDEWEEQCRASLAPYAATPERIVSAMLNFAGVTAYDVVYDLGCGDGRIVIAAAQGGANAVGVDLDAERIAEAAENVALAGVGDRVTLIQGDAMIVDVSGASVVTLFLTTQGQNRLGDRLLRDLRPGTRVVAYQFRAFPRQPDATRVWTDEDGTAQSLYLWHL